MNPEDKVQIKVVGRGSYAADETNAEHLIGNLTPEVLRDIARNESASREWRKAAVKFLVDRNHPYAWHTDVLQLRAEIAREREAEQEVRAVVESATEEPLEEV